MSLRPIVAAAGIAVALLAMAPAAQAGYVEIFGSPTYDPIAETGFNYPDMLTWSGSCVSNAGTAVGWAWRYDSGERMGYRAIRWDGRGTAATELGNLGTDATGYTYAYASAVNDANTAVGCARKYDGGTSLGLRAVRWDGGGTAATELGNLGTDADGYTETYALAVNNANTAVGCAEKYVDGSYVGVCAVRWDGGGTTATELRGLDAVNTDSTYAWAYAVNDVGTVVGRARKCTQAGYLGERAVRWEGGGTAATELDDIGTHATTGVTSARAVAVNEINTAVGWARKYVGTSDLGERAVRWDGGGTAATELDHLGTDADGHTETHAVAVNDGNTAVGWAEKYDGGIYLGHRAVRWDAGGTAATELSSLGTDASGFANVKAYDISDTNTAVGGASGRAVMWGPDGVAVDLNTLIDPNSGWMLVDAYAISEDGLWIAGRGLFDPDGAGPLGAYRRLWVMEVPEPAGLLLSIGAAVPLLLKRRRSRRGSPELASGLALGGLAMLRRRRSP